MTHLRINPEGIHSHNNYTHVIIARGSRMVFIAGQYPEDPSGKLVGRGDMAKQAAQAFAIWAWLCAPLVRSHRM